jgi:hypothetical protein
MHVQSISKFIFNKAEYLLADESGSLLLRIDYYHNTFEIEQQTETIKKSLHQEAKTIAQDLLSRKHGVNFAEK